MTKIHFRNHLLAFLACLVLAMGCATDQNDAQTKKKEQDPEIGMTKEQVTALYGKTDNVQVSSDGETWIYNLNMGEAFIPFNFGYRPKMRIITFDKEGKVAHWSYSK